MANANSTPTVRYATSELIADMQRVASVVAPGLMSVSAYERHGRYARRTIILRFGSWNAGMVAAGLSPNGFGHNTYSNDELIAELRRVAALVGSDVLSGPAFEQHSGIARLTFASRFGSWRKAVSAAGLKSPTVVGGQRAACVICGTSFPFDGGAKARTTCSRECTSLLQSRASFKGDDASPQAARSRARRHADLSRCERCGTTGRLHVHHQDRNPYNNAPSNIEVLCIPCHEREHHGERERVCAVCGKAFVFKKRDQFACSKACGGRLAASKRITPCRRAP